MVINHNYIKIQCRKCQSFFLKGNSQFCSSKCRGEWQAEHRKSIDKEKNRINCITRKIKLAKKIIKISSYSLFKKEKYMSTKIDKKIIGYKVVSEEKQPDQANEPMLESSVESMHENMERPEMLLGSTYKIKAPPGQDHALYITINDMVLNECTEHEERRPYEIFLNSKNMEHYQWITTLTRTISAIWRKGGNASFIAEELKSIHDPKGSYYKKGGVFMPSLVAEIGHIIESHLNIKPEISAEQKQLINQKRKEFDKIHGNTDAECKYPSQAVLCHKCNTKAVVMIENCCVCLSCSESKCN